MKRITYLISAALLALMALPKAIGLTLLYYVDNIGASFGEGVPSDLKSLNEAMEKAFKAMDENIKKVQDVASKALEEVRQEGTLHGKTNEQLTALSETGKKLQEDVGELKTRALELEQKVAKRPAGSAEMPKSIGAIVAESDEYKAIQGKNVANMPWVNIGSFHKVAIVNATLNNDQPLVVATRLPGIQLPGLRRLTVRDLLPSLPIQGNLVEFTRELTFTNNAGPQYDASPGSTEGALKPESGLTFELANAAVVTIGHWIPASRQVLADAPLLRAYIEGRLMYGLKLEEEDELLNGDGTAGTLNGLMNQATAFAYGSTNQTALDTLLKARMQVMLADLGDATGFVLHPIDWTNILLLKDTTGRYLFSDPHNMERPRVWALDVVPTASMAQGQFLTGNFTLGAEIYDREDASVRIAEQHADFFVRNMVAILAEERLALAVRRPTAFVKGSISHAG